MSDVLTEEQLLEQTGITRAQLGWLADRFWEQMRLLKKDAQYHPDAVRFLGSVAVMIDRGARPDQIKAWFGLD